QLLRRCPWCNGGTGQIPPAAAPAQGKAGAESAPWPCGSFPETPDPGYAGPHGAGGGALRKSAWQWTGTMRAPAASAARPPGAPAAARERIQACGGVEATWDGIIAWKIIQIGVTFRVVPASNPMAVLSFPVRMVSITNPEKLIWMVI